MTLNEHRLSIARYVLGATLFIDSVGLALVKIIDWATLPGPEAGIVSSVITAAMTSSSGLSAAVVGYYFSASPPPEKPQ